MEIEVSDAVPPGEMGFYDVPLLHMFRFPLGHDAEVFPVSSRGSPIPRNKESQVIIFQK